MAHSLSQRLQALADTYKQTLALIQELQNFPSSQSQPSSTTDDRRLELANEIHDSLKDQEDTLELLRQELDDDSAPTSRDRPSSLRAANSPSQHERDRNADLLVRLTEDLKGARSRFRRAQLQAKRNADEAKRKERETLFRQKTEGSTQQPQRRPGQEKLTQDELALHASEDVTRALRRAHDLLQGNLSQSQFAQQALDESQDALKGLGESYGGTGDLLKASRGLVGQLVRSNKSDTWYLQSAFYLLAVTIVWLVFRRWLYGPLWWLVWQPLKLMWWVTLSSLGTVGFGGGNAAAGSGGDSSMVVREGFNARGIPTHPPGMTHKSVELPAKGGGYVRQQPPQQQQHPEATSLVEQVGRMVEEAGKGRTGIDDLTEEERKLQEEQPRNSKKRMMEQEKETAVVKDEL